MLFNQTQHSTIRANLKRSTSCSNRNKQKANIDELYWLTCRQLKCKNDTAEFFKKCLILQILPSVQLQFTSQCLTFTTILCNITPSYVIDQSVYQSTEISLFFAINVMRNTAETFRRQSAGIAESGDVQSTSLAWNITVISTLPQSLSLSFSLHCFCTEATYPVSLKRQSAVTAVHILSLSFPLHWDPVSSSMHSVVSHWLAGWLARHCCCRLASSPCCSSKATAAPIGLALCAVLFTGRHCAAVCCWCINLQTQLEAISAQSKESRERQSQQHWLISPFGAIYCSIALWNSSSSRSLSVWHHQVSGCT